MYYETTEQEIAVADLRIGMHVIKLDRPWAETDFLLQGFIIQKQEDIDALQRQCTTVVIEGKIRRKDPEDGQTQSSRRKTSAFFSLLSQDKTNRKKEKPSKRPPPPSTNSLRKVTYINKVEVSHEVSRATRHYDEAKSVAKDIMSGLRIGRALDINKAREVVDDCVNSILRNDDALMLLTKLKHKDEYTAEHSLNVSILAAAFGKRLGLLEEEIRTLGLCGLLHDIGKAKVPADILQKPATLTPEEYAIMQNHANWGRDMLMALPKVVHATIDVAYNHHERLDGKGYPRGLVDYQIPYFAKIVAIVDTYDAITSNRAYDRGRSSMEALEIIHRFRGTQFDPELTREFVLMIGIYPPGSIVELKTGEIAVVIASNPKNRRKPKIMIVRNSDKQRPSKYRLADLASNPTDDHGQPLEILKEVPDGSHGVSLQRLIDNGLQLGYQTVDRISN
ncbi:HD-GYP domain-containing protein [Marinobacter nauticus]|uniref:HD-GYP domain-containing protein n=1 Tax=Marinobacter nauticus TaxID=2743 RepID=UPI004043A738